MLPPGVHTVRSAALDYVGNEGVVAAATFVVDGNPPAAPPQLAAQGASPSPWRSATTYALTWQHPPDVSGIAKAYVKVNGAQPAALGPVTAHTVDLGPNAAQGATPVFVWLEDNVQNTDPNNAAVVELRHDSVVPTMTASAPPKATVPPIAVPFTATEAGAGGKTPTASGVKKAVLWSRVVPAEATCAATPGPWTRSEEQAGPGEGVAAFSGAFAFTPPADGRWCFYVQGEDVAGNKTPDPAASAAAHGETLYDGTPPVLSALRVTDVTAKQASLAFESDKPATARVEWGLTAALGNAIPLPEATAFTTDLRGLPSAALIYYKVTLTSRVGRQSSSELRTFATPLDLSFAATIDDVIYPDQPIVIRLDNPSVGQAAYSIGGAAGSIPLSGSFSFFPPAVQGPATLDVIIDGATYSRTFLVDDPNRNFRVPRKVVGPGGEASASAASKILAAAGQPAATGDTPLASDRSRLFLGYLAGIDPTPPGAIADLAAVAGPGRGQVTLSWRAVGDDAGVGKAMVYELRRGSSPIVTENDYKNAVSVGLSVYPAPAGTAQTAVVSGLPDGTQLYFALKAVDEVLNRSPLGRVASAATLAFVASAESVGGVPAFELLTSVPGITVRQVAAPGSLPVLRAAAQGFVAGGPLFEVLAPVNPLPTPGLLTLRYDPAVVGAAELLLKAFRFDAELGSWELLADSQVSPDRDLVTATVGHFSYITLLAPDVEAPTTELVTVSGRRFVAPDGQVFLSAGTQSSLSARDPPVGSLPGTGVLRTESRTDGGPSVIRDSAPFTLPEGLHALAYRSFDAAGNAETLRSAVLRVDAAAPSPSLSSPEDSLTAPGGFTVLSTRAADGGLPRVVVSLADLLTSSGAGPGSGVARASFSVDGSPYQAFLDSVTLRLAPGRHLLRVLAEDNVGNAAEGAALPVAVGDLAAPRAALLVGHPRSGPFVSGRTVLTWTAEDDLLDAGDGLGSGASRLSVLADGAPLLEASRVPSRGGVLAATATLAGLGDGPHALRWSASDAFGNVAMGSATLTLDSRPPEFLAAAPGAFSSAAVAGLAVSYADSGVGVSSASVLLFVDGVATPAGSGLTGAGANVALAPGRHSAAWAVSDLLGQAASTATTFLVDRAPPVVTVFAPLGGERFFAGQSTVAVAFGVTDALTAPASSAALVQRADRGAPRRTRPDVVLTSSGATIDPFTLDDGVWELRVTAVDAAGNSTSAVSGAFEVIHDTLPPRSVLAFGAPSFADPGRGLVYVAPRTVLTLTSRDDMVQLGDAAGLGVAEQTVLLDGASYFAFVRPAGSTATLLASTFSVLGEDGIKSLRFGAKDVLGQEEPPLLSRVGLDDTPPVLASAFSRQPVVRSTASGAWFPEDFLVVWTATDTGSGLAFTSPPSSVTAEGRDILVAGAAADRLGHAAEASVTVNLDKTAPRVSAGSDLAVTEGSSVTFSGTVADKLDPAPTFSWRFPDGSRAEADPAPTAFYPDEGEFAAVLTSTDHAGHVAASSATVRVANAAPRLEAGGDRLIKEGEPLVLMVTFADPGLLDSHTASVDWGDGRSATMTVTEAGGAGSARAEHAYGNDGLYAAVVTVRDEDGGASTAAVRVTVQNQAPVLAALAGQQSLEGSTVALQAASFTDAGFNDSHSATVDWGDGTTEAAAISSQVVQAQHAYGDNGTYAVTVTVSDDDGGTASSSFTATISNVAPSLTALGDQTAAEGSLLNLQGAAFKDPGFRDTHSATVHWGDGTSEPAQVSSMTIQAQHTYGDNGAFAVTVTVSDDDGGASSRTFTATIVNAAPRLAALANQNAAEGSVVSLQGAQFRDPGFLDGHTATVDWGDGTGEAAVVSSQAVNASHSYGDDGIYGVTVTVADDDGGTVGSTFTATVTNVAPSLAALGDQTVVEGSLLSLQGATFTDPGPLDTHTASVDWGDGTTEAAVVSSQTVQPQHVYGDNGAYTVTVTVADDDGGISARSFTAAVSNATPDLAALTDQNAVEGAPVSLQGATFTDPSLADTHTATVNWGDGASTTAVVSGKTLFAQHAYGDDATYDVVVTVRDDDGGLSSATFKAIVANATPVLAVLSDQTGAEGSPFSLRSATFTDAGFLDTHTATVDWGDGTTAAATVSNQTLTAQHVYGDSGTYDVVVTVRDDEGAATSRTFKAVVSNAAPALTALADQTASEGAVLSLQNAVFTDAGSQDTHSASVNWGDGTTAPAVVSSKTLSAQHSFGDNGTYTVAVTVADDDGGTSVQSFTATIGNVAPSLAPLADQAAAEGSPVNLAGALFTDPGFLDTHSATVDWGDGAVEAAAISSKTILAQHVYGDNSTYTVTVTVADDDGGTSAKSFTATVNNVAPDPAVLADQTADEGSPVSLLGATFTDPGFRDTHTATVDWGDGTTEPTAISSKAVQATHTYGDNGAHVVAVTVSDDDGGASSRTFTATIANVAPSLAALANQNAAEGSFVGLQGAQFTDPGFLDGHTATVDWGDGTAATAAISSKTISAQHAYGDNGAHTVTVTVTDDDGGTAARNFTTTISNVAPTLAALVDRNAAEGSTLSLQGATFADPGFLDAHSATVDWGDGTSEAAVVSSQAIAASHSFGDNGSYAVTITVTDDDGGTSAQGFTATINNVAPSLPALAGQTAAEGSLVSLQGATFTDPGFSDSHTATVNWGDGTTQAAVITSKTVQAQHAYGDNGTYSVTVTVADDDGGTSTQSFTATVGNVAPDLAALANQTTDEGSTISLQGASFTDPGFLDSHTATVDWGDGTTEAASVSSNSVSALHAYGDNGAYTVTVTVADDDAGTSVGSFTATVNNVRPALAALAGQFVAEGSPVVLQGAVFTDPGFLDTHSATVDWGDGTVGAVAVSSMAVLAQHVYGDNGTYTVTVTVADDDGGLSARSFTATVANVAPSLAALSDQSAAEGSLVDLQGAVFTDPGSLDSHTGTVDWGDGTTTPAVISSKTLQANHAFGDNGAYLVTVTVNDDDGGASVKTFTATVSNATPVLAALADQNAAEGTFIALQGATFTDAGFLDSHTATVNWGDGNSEPAGVSTKTISAQHAYGDNGSYSVTVTVTDDDGGSAARTFTATIGNAAPTLAAMADQAAREGAFFQLPPAAFADVGYLDSHTATVDWGDGTTEPTADIALASTAEVQGTATAGTIQSSHAYGDNGVFTVVVTVRDDDGATSSSTFRVTVGNEAPALASLPDQAAVEGSFVQLPPAVFTDAGYLDTHRATIDWGDGTSEPAADIALTPAPGQEGAATTGTIQARHAYGDNGTYSAVVTVRDDDGAASSASFRVTVTNAAPALGALPDAAAAEGAFVQLPPAAFIDTGYKDTHSATVDWGDGTTEPAGDVTLTPTPGSEGTATSGTIQARHAYGDNGVFTAVVSVADDDGAVSSSSFKVTVSNALPTLAVLPDVNGAEGAFIQLPPAAFADAGYLDLHTATIDWGDGTTEPAADIVMMRSAGQEGVATAGTLLARHAYADNGIFTAQVTIRDDDGGSATTPMRVTVANAAPAVAALPDALSGAGGAVYVGGQIPVRFFQAYAYRGAWTLTNYALGPEVVQTFAPAVYSDPGFDNPPGGTREDFTAAVAWGDEKTTSGVAVDETPGSEGLSTVGRAHGAVHQYAANGVYNVTVSVSDDDAGAGSRVFSVTVDREPPVTRVGYVGAYLMASAAPAAVPSGLDVFLRSNSDIVLAAEDPRVNDVASGIQRTFWREGQFAPFVLYTGPFRTPGAGSHVVEYFSVDERGNEEPHKLLRIGVDDSAPTSAVAYGTAAVSVFGLPLLTSDTPVTLSAADLEAAGVAVGVARVAYRLDGGPETPYAAPFMVPAQGTHRLDVRAYDRLGNVSPKTVRFAVAAFQAGGLAGFERVDGSGTADVAGPVLSNGPADFSGSVAVNGDVAAASVTIRGQARVSGAVRQGASPLHPEPIDLALIAELAAAASANALIPADLLVDGALVLGSGRTHALTTGTYVLKGLKLDGGASLAIHGRVDILVDGALEVSGGAALNAEGRADDVNLFVAAASTVSLAGGARVAATVYAPRAPVRVAGNARVAGSLAGRSATVSGTGNVLTNGRTLPPGPVSAGGGDKAGRGAKTASMAAAPAAPAFGADTTFALRDLYVFPNPALDGARPTIHLAVGVADKVTIRIFDVSGRPVHQATLDAPPPVIDDGAGPKHAYEHAWEGRIPSGVYLYTVTAEKAGQPAIRKAGKFSVVR